MQSKVLPCMIAIVVAGMSMGLDRLSAQDQPGNKRPDHYRVFNLGTLNGGLSSSGSAINHSSVTGVSNVAGNADVHATLWAGGRPLDLGTLGGANSAVEWPFKNNRGKIVGISETANVDPAGEDWSCSAFFIPPATQHTCVGFVWERGRMTALPTLGGENGYASGANDRNQEVGWAENTVKDPTCVAPQVFQFQAVVYGPENDKVRQLPPLPGDMDGAATAINNKGQVVGISGTCDNAVGAFSAKHAVLWQNGTVVDIGNLGGAGWNTPYAINDRGQVVGFSDLPGDVVDGVLSFNAHAFLWTKGDGIQDLGTLPGDSISEAVDINDRGQVVGLSCGATTCRAFVWQNGVMMDMNALIPQNSSLYLTAASAIDSRGIITGQACVLSNGACLPTSATPAFVAAPIDHEAAAETDRHVRPKVDLPAAMRHRLMVPKGAHDFSPEPVPAR